MRLSVLTGGPALLLGLIGAAARFRALNESWGAGDDWEAAFDAESKSWLQRRRERSEADAYRAAAEAVLDAVRAIRHAAEASPGPDARDRLDDFNRPAALPRRAQPEAYELTYGEPSYWFDPSVVVMSVVGVGFAGFIVTLISTLGGTIPEGLNEACVIGSMSDASGQYAAFSTSCGTASFRDVFLDQVAVGETYDFEVNFLEGERVGIPMLLGR